ncbi:hypothetical protein ACJX0J_032342, partial [Zea mays]
YFKSQNLAANIKHQTSILSKKDYLHLWHWIDYMDSKHVTWSLEKKDSSKHQTSILFACAKWENNLNNMFGALQVVNCHAFIN